jgi:hypothetical protein
MSLQLIGICCGLAVCQGSGQNLGPGGGCSRVNATASSFDFSQLTYPTHRAVLAGGRYRQTKQTT